MAVGLKINSVLMTSGFRSGLLIINFDVYDEGLVIERIGRKK